MSAKKRLYALDSIRGITLLSMIAYHAMWDLVYMFGVRADWYRSDGAHLWQQSICWTFIILAGFCWQLSRNHWKRGLPIFCGGIVVSLATHIFMPTSRITFGILTFTGSAVLLMIPLEKLLKHVPPLPGLAVSAALFALLRNVPGGTLGFEGLVLGALPRQWYRNYFTAYFGFRPPLFYSSDYFPLIPWLLLFICGYFLFRFFRDRGWIEKLFSKGQFPVLNFLGRNSLLVYLLHQPIIYGLMELFLG